MLYLKRNQKGLTLIEMLVGLLILILAIVFIVFLVSYAIDKPKQTGIANDLDFYNQEAFLTLQELPVHEMTLEEITESFNKGLPDNMKFTINEDGVTGYTTSYMNPYDEPYYLESLEINPKIIEIKTVGKEESEVYLSAVLNDKGTVDSLTQGFGKNNKRLSLINVEAVNERYNQDFTISKVSDPVIELPILLGDIITDNPLITKGSDINLDWPDVDDWNNSDSSNYRLEISYNEGDFILLSDTGLNSNFVHSIRNKISDINIQYRVRAESELGNSDWIYSAKFNLINSSYSSCLDIKNNNPDSLSGVYSIKPSTHEFSVYCDMLTDGGGWTLVWSNLRSKTGRSTTNMSWSTATTTLPIIRNGSLNSNLESFEVYTGLNIWNSIMKDREIMYLWSSNYNRSIEQGFKSNIEPFNTTTYTLKLSNYVQLYGSQQAGMFNYHNNHNFSAINKDMDGYSGYHCASYYSKTPWWYRSCWSGSINGGGEYSGNGYYNGAYWISSAKSWGSPDGSGAGNGWIFIR